MSRLINMTIGCLGAGNMGGAILKGLASGKSGVKQVVYDIDTRKSEYLKEKAGAHVCKSAVDLCRKSDIIILAVKPDGVIALLRELRESIAEKIVVSIAAGVRIASMEEAVGAGVQIIRVMPNTPALVGEGMSVLSPGSRIDPESVEVVEDVFKYIGRTMILPEKLMDAVTAVSGCGPAYVFTMIQAMADGAVKLGIPRDSAIVLAAQTLAGAAKMVLDSGEDPISLRGRVTSPGGSTIAAVHCLERAGFSGIIMDAVEEAAVKSGKLGGVTE